MEAKVRYQFSASLWQHSPQGGWVFVSLPIELSKEIRAHFQWQEEGWGRMKATAIIESLEWDTAIWFDAKQQRYLLPLKAAIRKRGGFQLDDEVSVTLLI